MSRPIENEVKIAITGVAPVKRLLKAAGYRVRRARVYEQNMVLDTPGDTLRAAGLLLRVRTAGKLVTCTFKGKTLPGVHRAREEREFTASSLEECLAVFGGLGYAPRFRYEKYRTEYEIPGEAGHVTLDETPIGVFIELEGPGAWLDGAAKQLGFSRDDYIKLSYGRLWEMWCAEHGLPRADMVFAAAGTPA